MACYATKCEEVKVSCKSPKIKARSNSILVEHHVIKEISIHSFPFYPTLHYWSRLKLPQIRPKGTADLSVELIMEHFIIARDLKGGLLAYKHKMLRTQ